MTFDTLAFSFGNPHRGGASEAPPAGACPAGGDTSPGLSGAGQSSPAVLTNSSVNVVGSATSSGRPRDRNQVDTFATSRARNSRPLGLAARSTTGGRSLRISVPSWTRRLYAD